MSSEEQSSPSQKNRTSDRSDTLGGTRTARHRDKRGQLTTSSSSASSSTASLDMNDPFQILALAIRYDESRMDEAILQVPLETGRLYSSNKTSTTSNRQFAQALEYLQQETTPPVRLASNNSTSRLTSFFHTIINGNQSPPPPSESPSSPSSSPAASTGSKSHRHNKHRRPDDTDPQQADQHSSNAPFALAPIILSGLVAAIQQERHLQDKKEQHKDTSDSDVPQDIAAQLIMACQTMRKAALQRVRRRLYYSKLQRVVLPVASLILFCILYLQSVSEMRTLLVKLRYAGSCPQTGMYETVCRVTEAHLWNKYRNYLTTLVETESCPVSEDGLDLSSRPDCTHQLLRQDTSHSRTESPFAMHTTLRQDLISMDEIREGKSVQNKPYHKQGWATSTGDSLQWLGISNVNRLVMEAIQTYLPEKTKDMHILDVGCGVGGSLYSLWPLTKKFKNSFRYHGIAVSAAEIHMADRLARHHGVLKNKDGPPSIVFEQRSFDDSPTTSQNQPSSSYNVLVAIESLSYSRNLKETLSNLMKSLKSNGILIVVDDIVLPSDAGRIALDDYTLKLRPSLLTHASWKGSLEEAGCSVKLSRDLSVEYELQGLLESPSSHSFPSSDGGTQTSGLSNDIVGFLTRLVPSVSFGSSLWQYGVLWENLVTMGNGNVASRRLVQLYEDRNELVRVENKRKENYERQSLSYQMYVCMKK